MSPIPAEHAPARLPSSQLASLREARELAIAEIAGRDSVAAAIVAADRDGFRTLLPTIACAGFEYGDFEAPLRAVEHLRSALPEVAVLDPIWLEAPRLWSALNDTFAEEIRARFGLSSACLACHLTLHLMRVPLARALGGVPVIAGERDTHDGRIKWSQTVRSIDAGIEVFEHAELDLLQPIREATTADVEALVGEGWAEGGGQLKCRLSGNYAAADGSVEYDDTKHARYAREFLVPVGVAVTDAWLREPEPDYEALVRGILQR